MKYILLLIFTLCFSLAGHGEMVNSTKIKMTFDGKELIVNLYENPASRDLLSRLPLVLEFKDYASTEKISYLSEKLATQGTSLSGRGDFAYYAPWGNLAVFYQSIASDVSGLYILGTIESGKEDLAAMKKDFTAKLEKIGE